MIYYWLKDMSTLDFSTKNFNPGPFNPRPFNHELFNPGLFNHYFLNHGVEKFMVEKHEKGIDFSTPDFSMQPQKIMVEKSGVEISFNLLER